MKEDGTINITKDHMEQEAEDKRHGHLGYGRNGATHKP